MAEPDQGLVAREHWGPCPSDHRWAALREDSSWDGDAWNCFPFDHTRARACPNLVDTVETVKGSASVFSETEAR